VLDQRLLRLRVDDCPADGTSPFHGNTVALLGRERNRERQRCCACLVGCCDLPRDRVLTVQIKPGSRHVAWPSGMCLVPETRDLSLADGATNRELQVPPWLKDANLTAAL